MDNKHAADESRLPPDAHGAWRIEMRYLPIGPRGHAFLTLVDPEGAAVAQLHGLAESRNTGKIVPLGSDGSKLVTRDNYWMSPEQTKKVGDVAAGTYDEIVRGKWAHGLQAADELNRRDLDYKGDDLSYETIGGNGGEIQNSNSVAHTFGKAMDLDLDAAIGDAGMDRKFPGWGRNLLDPAYTPYIAPPQFPTDNRP